MEYEHLRSEIERSIRNQVQVLGYGGAALSLLVGLGIDSRQITLLVALPFLAFFFFMLWSMEQTRMMRAGDYISGLEDRANEQFLEEGSLGWEGWLNYRAQRHDRDVYDLHYYSQYGVLGGFIVILGLSSLLLWAGPDLMGSDWPSVLTVQVRWFLTGTYVLMAAISTVFLLRTVRHGDIKTSLKAYYKNLSDDVQ